MPRAVKTVASFSFLFSLCFLLPVPMEAADYLTIDSRPPGATVEIDGVVIGTTPYKVEVPGGYLHKTKSVFGKRLEHQMHVRVAHDGYLSKEADLASGPMRWVALDGTYHGDYWLLKNNTFIFILEKAATSFAGNAQFPHSDAEPTVDRSQSPIIDELKRRAEQGDADAQYKLGEMYGTGSGGVLKDVAEEMRWYRMAAEQGDPNGQNALGGMYRRGEGVPQDYAEAARWLLKAAEQGNVNGQGWLGSMYEEGKGLQEDRSLALYWYSKAAKQGDNWARDQAQRLRTAGVKLPGTNDAESSVAKPQPQVERRLVLDEIEDLLTGEVSPKRAAMLVQQYGVNFELTDRIKERLRRLGADEELLVAIAKNRR